MLKINNLFKIIKDSDIFTRCFCSICIPNSWPFHHWPAPQQQLANNINFVAKVTTAAAAARAPATATATVAAAIVSFQGCCCCCCCVVSTLTRRLISFCVWASNLIAFQLPLTCAWQQYVTEPALVAATVAAAAAAVAAANCAAATVLFVAAYLSLSRQENSSNWPVNQRNNSGNWQQTARQHACAAKSHVRATKATPKPYIL